MEEALGKQCSHTFISDTFTVVFRYMTKRNNLLCITNLNHSLSHTPTSYFCYCQWLSFAFDWSVRDGQMEPLNSYSYNSYWTFSEVLVKSCTSAGFFVNSVYLQQNADFFLTTLFLVIALSHSYLLSLQFTGYPKCSCSLSITPFKTCRLRTVLKIAQQLPWSCSEVTV